jgi:hypothetical protein
MENLKLYQEIKELKKKLEDQQKNEGLQSFLEATEGNSNQGEDQEKHTVAI